MDLPQSYVDSAADDIAQGTGFAELSVKGIGDGADESGVGELHLFNPSSTTYVKHFYSTMNCYSENIELLESRQFRLQTQISRTSSPTLPPVTA